MRELNIGDVISWFHDGIEYFSKVLSITEEGDACVQIAYDNYGYTQDRIPLSDIKSFYDLRHI